MRPWLRVLEAGLDLLTRRRLGADRSRAGLRRALGDAGELRAFFLLRREGYVVVARKWEDPRTDGEIDLIAWDGETLCFVEVKTRGERDRFAPERQIHERKRRAMRNAASVYVRGLFPEEQALPQMRMDVVTVLKLRREWRLSLQRGDTPLRLQR